MISGNYTLQNCSSLIMTNKDDYIFVNGNFNISTTNNETGCLSDGILEIAGDFSQSGNAYSFAASGNNMVILSGSKIQNIYFANPQTSHFNDIDVSMSAGVKCNYSVNINVANLIGTLPGMWSIAEMINLLQSLGMADISSILNNSINIILNENNLQYLSSADIQSIVLGICVSADDNLYFGAVQAIEEKIIGNYPPEDNYYYMFGKVTGDRLFLSVFIATAGIATVDTGKSLAAAAESGGLGLIFSETGIGFVVCETAAGAELVEALGAAVVAAVSGADAIHSKNVLSNDLQKLAVAKEGAAEATKVGKTPTYKLRAIWEEYTGTKATGEVHHGLPEEFKDWFSDRKIDVNSGEYLFDLPRDIDRLKAGNGIHTNSSPLGEEWNSIWERFIDENPNASKRQIVDKLNDMSKEAGIDGYKAIKK